ncbi:hypothetical protein JCM1840_001748 [Sporobolomyces johnsonii]
MDPDPDLKAKYVELLEKYSTTQEKQLALQEKLMRLGKELGEKDRLIAKLKSKALRSARLREEQIEAYETEEGDDGAMKSGDGAEEAEAKEGPTLATEENKSFLSKFLQGSLKKAKKDTKEPDWEKLRPAYGKSIDELKALCKTITDAQVFSMATNSGIKKGRKKNHILSDLHEWVGPFPSLCAHQPDRVQLLHNCHCDPEEERKSAAAAEAFPSASGSKDICFGTEPVREESEES